MVSVFLAFKEASKIKLDPIHINQSVIPVTVYLERRNGYRASFTKTGLNIRIPKHYSIPKQKKMIEKLLDWAHEALQKKPQLLQKYVVKSISHGSTITTFDQSFTVVCQYEPRKTIGMHIQNQQIMFKIPIELKDFEIEPKYISKVLAAHYKPFFKERLNYWNNLFPKQHNTMRLKYNSSNWGSCSTKGNINLSTRLFLCPLPVIDYVMVHELAHLIHHNHSKSFWEEVKRVMPDYKQHAKWLKTDGAHLDFKEKNAVHK